MMIAAARVFRYPQADIWPKMEMLYKPMATAVTNDGARIVQAISHIRLQK